MVDSQQQLPRHVHFLKTPLIFRGFQGVVSYTGCFRGQCSPTKSWLLSRCGPARPSLRALPAHPLRPTPASLGLGVLQGLFFRNAVVLGTNVWVVKNGRVGL